MTEINHNAIKQQMVNILQANTNLFDIDDENKFTYIEVGEPEGNPFPTPPTYPALWVTSSRTLETINRKGINVSNRHSFLTHDVSYLLKFMVVEQDSIVAEKQLDEFQKTIMETLENDIELLGTIWSTGVNFVVDDVVSFEGSLYICIQDNLSANGNNPTFPAFWTFQSTLPGDTWPERVETFRQELDGQGIRGKTITWKFIFTTD